MGLVLCMCVSVELVHFVYYIDIDFASSNGYAHREHKDKWAKKVEN